MQLSLLADVPQFISEISEAHYAEWSHSLANEFGVFNECDYQHLIAEYMNRDGKMPFMLVAHMDGTDLLGTVCIQQQDLPSLRPDLESWMASLYVVPDARRLGFGSAIARAAVSMAKEVGLSKLHLWTDKKELVEWYGRLGWSMLDKSQIYFERKISIMSIEF